MPRRETIFALLQLIALTLPAIAIYLDIYLRDKNPRDMAAGPSGPFHGLRLAFLWMIGAAILLLGALFFEPVLQNSVLDGALYLAIVFTVVGLATFALPFLFNPDFLQNDFNMLWVYRNAYHHTSTIVTDWWNRISRSRGSDEDDEAGA